MKIPFKISKLKYRLYKEIIAEKYNMSESCSFTSILHLALEETIRNCIDDDLLETLNREEKKKLFRILDNGKNK